ncbi:MAG: hypothetical protein J0M35_20750 [Candidatus Obscuribacter phosphatis]|uniref:Uncharacterized protein n=1 Tax=Candidatus Obscuribacter phosphatis TaxID=1906157 RepID=A0A8J7TPG8_9BACT|nr:hypothetical protein [Candidatus Obscuribacter phosphatis]
MALLVVALRQIAVVGYCEKPGAAKAKAIDVVRSWPRPEIDKLKQVIRNGLSLFIDRLLIVGQ